MIPKNLLYTEDHEWVLIENNMATVGITDFAQSELGDIVFIELPEVGQSFTMGDTIGSIEAVKTVADVFCPLSGKIVEVNEALENNPEKINGDCYGEGWIIKMELSNPEETTKLLSPDEYADTIQEED